MLRACAFGTLHRRAAGNLFNLPKHKSNAYKYQKSLSVTF
jgi:hypothetical protein